jgi:hypothetical protein
MSQGKPKPDVEVVDDLSNMEYDELITALTLLNDEKEQVVNQRSYLQIERDLLENLFKNSESTFKDYETQVLIQEKVLQDAEETHKTEIRTYLQKLKQLEFENERNMTIIEAKGKEYMSQEVKYHNDKLDEFKNQKQDLKAQFQQTQQEGIKTIHKKEQKIRNMLETAKSEFSKELKRYESKNEENLELLRKELDLKIRTELHEIEERKNVHINELIKNHEKAFEELKSFYNYITIENLNLIRSQKEELANCKARHDVSQKKLGELKEKNNALEVN